MSILDSFKLDGKVALVTGANRGIGAAITRALLERGARKVYAGARRVDTLAVLVAEFGDRVAPLELDVTDGEPTPHGDPVTRAAEAAEAARILGVTRRTLEFPNRRLEPSLAALYAGGGLKALEELPGIGHSIAASIVMYEYLRQNGPWQLQADAASPLS